MEQQIPNSTCLRCKAVGSLFYHPQKIEYTDDFKITPVRCVACGATWKDFEGKDNETSPVISIQRNTGDTSSLPTVQQE